MPQCVARRKNCFAWIIGDEESKSIEYGPFFGKQLKDFLKDHPEIDQSKVWQCVYRYQGKEDKSTHCPICNHPRACVRSAVDGYSVCHQHGAGSPNKGRFGGVGQKKIIKDITGKRRALTNNRIKNLGDLGPVYEQILNDENLLRYEKDIAQAELRIEELNTQTDPGYYFWDNLVKVFKKYDESRKLLADDEQMRYANLEDAIKAGFNNVMGWREIRDWMGTRKGLIDSKLKYQIQQEKIWTIEKVMDYSNALASIVIAALLDPGIRTMEDRVKVIEYKVGLLQQGYGVGIEDGIEKERM